MTTTDENVWLCVECIHPEAGIEESVGLYVESVSLISGGTA